MLSNAFGMVSLQVRIISFSPTNQCNNSLLIIPYLVLGINIELAFIPIKTDGYGFFGSITCLLVSSFLMIVPSISVSNFKHLIIVSLQMTQGSFPKDHQHQSKTDTHIHVIFSFKGCHSIVPGFI